jgi:hypothetical protein
MKKFKFLREHLVKCLPSGVVAEIGVANGSFSETILTLNNPTKLLLIDAWENFNLGYTDDNMVPSDDQQKRYTDVCKKFEKNTNVHIIRSKSGDAVKALDDNMLDWVYIDGDHSYQGCFSDLKDYDKKVKPDGYICGHDWLPDGYSIDGFSVNQAVIDFVEEKNYIITFITKEKKFKSYVISKNLESSEKLLEKIKEVIGR